VLAERGGTVGSLRAELERRAPAGPGTEVGDWLSD
jgi:hypothetical protein